MPFRRRVYHPVSSGPQAPFDAETIAKLYLDPGQVPGHKARTQRDAERLRLHGPLRPDPLPY